MDGHENDILDGTAPANPTEPVAPAMSETPEIPTTPAAGGIFSGSDTRIETENLPENLPTAVQPAPASAITPANRTTSTVTGDLKLGGAPKKKKWPLVVVGGVIIATIIVVVWAIISHNFTNKTKNVVGETNLSAIFDETAPIPAEQNGQYGYLDPKNGGWVITPQYLAASSFYGDYAAVSFSQANQQKVAIINRSGETVVTQESGSVDAYYDIQNNIWVVGGNIYDSSMKKLNADGVTGNYIGNGYILSSTQVEEDVNNSQETAPESDGTSEEGSTSSSSSTTSDGDARTKTIGRIEDLNGNVRYDCQGFCTANTTNDGSGHVYAVVRNWGEPAKIIALPSGDVLYTASESNRIQILRDIIFVEDSSNTKKYLKVEDGKVSIVDDKVKDARATISNAGEYYAEECNGRNSILKINGEIVMKCDVTDYTELPETTYLMYQATFSKDPLFVEREDKIELANLKKADTSQTFELGDVTVYDNSPFFYLLSNNGVAKVCNLLKGADKCIEIEDGNADIAGFGNYLTITSGDKVRIYNADLEMIHE